MNSDSYNYHYLINQVAHVVDNQTDRPHLEVDQIVVMLGLVAAVFGFLLCIWLLGKQMVKKRRHKNPEDQ